MERCGQLLLPVVESGDNSVATFTSGVTDTCRRRHLLGCNDEVLVALSWGADSTALLSALAEMRDAGHVGRLTAVHVDHALRPGSHLDGETCSLVCASLGVPLRRVKVEVRGGNVQAEARRARYAALRREAARVGATRIATGHTQDDQAETVVLRLLRGSGARGLSGIPPRRGPIVRPLIDRSRAEVIAYVRMHELPHVEDPSNATPRFLRNRVRAEVIPALRALAPHASRALARAADLLRDDERALAGEGRRLAATGSVRVEGLLAEPVAVRRRVVRDLWRRASGRRADLEARQVESVLALLGRGAPSRAPLSRGFEACIRYGALTIRTAPGTVPVAEPLRIAGPGAHALPEGGVIEVASAVGAAWPLWWRGRLPGDRFRPAGGRGSKKLKAWLIDRKVPREVRDALRVLADDAGWILWIPELGARSEKPSADASFGG
jgi:tRNA(Ile)-lysidine synthase